MRKSLIYTTISAICLCLATAPAADAKKQRRRSSSKAKSAAVAKPAPQPTAKSVNVEKQRTQKEIAETRKKIKDNTRQTQKSLDEIENLGHKIARQERHIAVLNDSISALDTQITHLDDSLANLAATVKGMRADLAATMRDTRRHRLTAGNLAFVFSAHDFASALKRVHYLKRVNAMRTAKINALSQKIAQIDDRQKHLDRLRTQQSAVLSTADAARQTLSQQRRQQQNTVTKLKGEGKQLNALLAQKQKRARELDRQLDAIIAAEARRAEAERRKKAEREKAERQAREAREAREAKEKAQNRAGKTDAKPQSPAVADTKQPATAKPAATVGTSDESARTLDDSFAKNRGNLLFPVAGKYSVVGTFGRGAHAGVSNVEVNNSGIDVLVSPGAKARAVHNGTVSSVFFMSGYQNIVILRHGDYLTVYAGLTGLSVKKGDTVKAGTNLGTVFSDPAEDNRTVLHFEVRHERQKLNPLDWVR